MPEARERSPGASGLSWVGLVKPKGNLSRVELWLLLALAALPLLAIAARITALPGVTGAGENGPVLELVRSLGDVLNRNFSLRQSPPADRDAILYLLFLPTCAVLISLARLTFGLRVLGFRSILIAVGFQESGVVPSLILIAVVVLTIASLRPLLRRIRLPYYARVSVILCIVAMTLVAALLAAPWLRSEVVWRVAFFPVIVLGLLAEGIAKALDRDSGLNAVWRAGSTIAIAFLIAGICQIPALREMALHFPELLVTQIVAIVLISEFLDFRLLQDWDARLSGMAVPNLFASAGGHRVAVVCNRRRSGVIGRHGRSGPPPQGRRSVRRVVAALRDGGHTVRVLEGDVALLSGLQDFMPPHARTGAPGGIVFNLAQGIQGEAPHTHVPAMLEMAGVPYTGPTPLGHALARDPSLAGSRSKRDGSSTSPSAPGAAPAARADGERELHVGLLGNDPIECLPLVELCSGRPRQRCPARVEEPVAQRVREVARAAFHACQGRDYGSVTVRVGRSGRPAVVAVESIGALQRGGPFVLAAERAGYPFGALVCHIVEVARARSMRGVLAEALPRPRRGATAAFGAPAREGSH